MSDPELADLQAAWKAASNDRERRLRALDFEQKSRAAQPGKQVGGLHQGAYAPADFFPFCLTHTKGPAAGKPFALESWQRRFVDELYKVDDRGNRIFKRAILGIPRGNGKSPLAAGLGLSRAHEPGGRAGHHLRGCGPRPRPASSSSTPALSQSRAQSPTSSSSATRDLPRPETRGFSRTISADGYVAHGINPSAAIIDEAHAFTTAKQRELFEAIDTAVHKRPDAYWLLITTAGHDRASLLGKLFADVLEQLEPEHPAPGLTTASSVRRTASSSTGTARRPTATPTTSSFGRPSTPARG